MAEPVLVHADGQALAQPLAALRLLLGHTAAGQVVLNQRAHLVERARLLRPEGDELILIRFQDEPNSGRVSAWQDHAGLIHSLFSGRN